MKKCARCRETLPHSEFNKNRTKTDGYQSYCKTCHGIAQRATPGYNSADKKIKQRLYKRGVTAAELDRLIERAAGRCEICGTQLDLVSGLKGLVIDHVERLPVGQRGRGLLCDPCNRGLGCFRDDPSRLEAAISYLEAA